MAWMICVLCRAARKQGEASLRGAGGGSSLESNPFQLGGTSNPYYISHVQTTAVPHVCSMRHVVADRNEFETYDS